MNRREISGQLTNNSSALVDLTLIVLSNFIAVLDPDKFLAERFQRRGDALKLALVHPRDMRRNRIIGRTLTFIYPKVPIKKPIRTVFPTTISTYRNRYNCVVTPRSFKQSSSSFPSGRMTSNSYSHFLPTFCRPSSQLCHHLLYMHSNY